MARGSSIGDPRTIRVYSRRGGFRLRDVDPSQDPKDKGGPSGSGVGGGSSGSFDPRDSCPTFRTLRDVGQQMLELLEVAAILACSGVPDVKPPGPESGGGGPEIDKDDDGGESDSKCQEAQKAVEDQKDLLKRIDEWLEDNCGDLLG